MAVLYKAYVLCFTSHKPLIYKRFNRILTDIRLAINNNINTLSIHIYI